MGKLRMAVVGVGALGRHHARILGEMPSVELVGVADPREEQGRVVAEQCGTEWTPDYRTLLGKVDAASIVVPTTMHLEVASAFLGRDIPVLIEKPLADHIDAGDQLIKLADERNVLLQVGHIERFNPAFEKMQELAGPPKYIRAERFSSYAFRSMDISVVHDVMIHDIDLVLKLADAPVSKIDAFGMCVVGGMTDCAMARLTFANGCIADLSANRVNPFPRRSLQVWSDTGFLEADLQVQRVCHFRPGPALMAGELPYDLAFQPGVDIDELKTQIFGKYIERRVIDVPQVDQLTVELESFVDCVTNNRRPRVDGHDGLHALHVADGITTGIARHQWDGTPAGRVGPHAHAVFTTDRRRVA
ncbi:MAG: Gfo/Idh/MocA family oxidoreductase [Maioricimonas sp. JB049]